MSSSGTASTAPRQARLFVSRIDPWSVAKTTFLVSLVLAIVIIVAICTLWWLLDATGVFAALTVTVNDIVGSSGSTFDLTTVLDFRRVLGVSVILGAFEVLLVTLLVTAFAVAYNVTVGLTHGIEVVLTDTP